MGGSNSSCWTRETSNISLVKSRFISSGKMISLDGHTYFVNEDDYDKILKGDINIRQLTRHELINEFLHLEE